MSKNVLVLVGLGLLIAGYILLNSGGSGDVIVPVYVGPTPQPKTGSWFDICIMDRTQMLGHAPNSIESNQIQFGCIGANEQWSYQFYTKK